MDGEMGWVKFDDLCTSICNQIEIAIVSLVKLFPLLNNNLIKNP